MLNIYCHSDPTQSWCSNYDFYNFWTTAPANAWKTQQFVTKLQSIAPNGYQKYNIIPYTETATNGYYLMFCGSSTSVLEHHSMAFLTSDIVEKVNQGNLKLLIAFVHETFDSDTSMREWFWNFGNIMTRVGIKRSHSVVFFTSTKTGSALHHDDRCDFIYYPWFEMDLWAAFKQHRISQPPIDLSKKEKTFINLNLSPRPHRFLMVMYLYYRKLINHGYVSRRNPAIRKNWHEMLSGDGFDEYSFGYRGQLSSPIASGFFYFVDAMKKLPDLILDDADLTNNGTLNSSWIGAAEFYSRARIDLVSETHPELYGNIFLTEKTFKPIAYGIPFMVNGTQHHLKGIKSLGYETFPELFDESYDDMPGTLGKIIKIAEELNLLCIDPNKQQILSSPEVQEKVKHNQDLFWNRDHHTAIADLLTEYWLLGHA